MAITRLNTSSLTGVTIPNTSINNASLNSVTALPSGVDVGKVGQVVSAVNTTAYQTTSSSYTDITGLTLNITPSATSSKILIMLQMTTQVFNGGSNNTNGDIKLLRDSTDIQTLDHYHRLAIGNGEPDNSTVSGSHIFLDSPSSTSQITFKYQGRSQAQTFRVTTKNMVAMEILA